VAGCSEGAPSVQAPPNTATSSVPTAPATGGGATSTNTPVPTETGVPTQSSAPASATGDPSKVCTTDDDFITPGAIAPSTKKTTWGKPLDTSLKYHGTVTITPSAPVAKKPASDDLFGPDNGQIYLLVKVNVKYKSGPSSTLYDMYFTLRDTGNNVCDDNSLNQAVPKQQQFDEGTVDKTTTSYTGTLVFEVPAGQDYKKYKLMYRPDDFDNKSTAAPVAWTS
jgi:hypothetical protein